MKRFLIILVIIITAYFLISLILLGRFTYWTSFNESTIPDSKKENLYVTENLKIEVTGDSLNSWNKKFEIWTNKRYGIKYYGFIFHWTFENSNWRYLNINPKNYIEGNSIARSKLRINEYERDYMKNFTGGYENCCNRISCEVGDTVTIEFIDWKKNNYLGAIKILIE